MHGLTAHGYWWLPLARELSARRGRIRLFAVCLRGRADSLAVGSPYGFSTHAADVAEVAERLGITPVLLGHSLGAFVAALALGRYPVTFPRGGALVDGGVAVALPDGLDPQRVARELLRPAVHRLQRHFPHADAYVADWGRHPGLRPVLRTADPQLLRDIALHDAVASVDRGLRCGVAEEAVRADSRDVAQAARAEVGPTSAVERGAPVELVWARRGLLDEPHGFYDEAALAAHAPAGMKTTLVEDANHLSVVLVDPGVQVIADVLERMTAHVG